MIDRDQIGLEKAHLRKYFDEVWKQCDNPWNFKAGNIIVKKKIEIIEPYAVSASSIIDLGCGGGEFMAALIGNRKPEIVFGVDISPKAVAKAETAGVFNRLIAADINDALESINRTFDLVLLNEVLYYQKDYRALVQNVAARLAAPNSVIFIALAIGPKFLSERDGKSVMSLFPASKWRLEKKARVGYTFKKIPLRFVFWKKFSQTHKLILIYRKMQ
ncbi:class I SAM-dependent methyltransferase [Patescibacteria group bacterium]|nr:class I SAM-dependent methyltransferase [Patescibacteria group bacterium]